MVVAAQQPDGDDARTAVASLCEIYWFPLYSFVRGRGYREDKAKDLTQEFFRQFLERSHVTSADRDRGKFRAFLLACMKNFLANEWDKTQAFKRGGGQTKLSLDFERGEGLLAELATDQYSPETLYDRNWAQTLVATSFRDLERDYQNSGKNDLFQALRGFITGDSPTPSYKEVGECLGMSEGAVKVAVHRLRKRFGECLRHGVAETLSDESTVEEELKYLISLL
jgi:RNA polymerase sigma-70 factor (ECF subfamily)